MRITVAVSELQRVLARAMSVVESKVTIPVLSYIKIDASLAGSTVSGSDLGKNIISNFAPLQADEGSILVPGQEMKQLVDKLTGENATIEEDGTNIRVKSGKASVKLAGRAVGEFPATETMPPVQYILPLNALKQLISRVQFAVSTKNLSIPVIQIESVDKRLVAVATDGYRIAVAKADGIETPFTMLLAKTALPLVQDLTGETVQISESETNYFFKTDSDTLVVRKSPAKFPDYRKAMGGTFKTSITVDSSSLKLVVNRILIFAPDEHPKAIFEYTAGAEDIIVSSGKEIGSITDATGVKATGESNRAKLNPSFVSDFLSQAKGDISIELINERSLVRFKNGEDYIYLIMPMVDAAPKQEEKPKEAAKK